MLPTPILRRGSAEPLPERVPLRAGPLSLLYEAGSLRAIRLGDREVLRAIYVAVRDRDWGTIPPAFSEVRIERDADRFRIAFLAEHRQGPIDFAWRGAITGDPDGMIAFAMDGAARSTFLRTRIGFCILHPPGPCAGQPCVVEHASGGRTEGTFPLHIAPHQPFVDMRAIGHEVAPGIRAEVRFAGDIFEMEDQRNWTDDSYKTYCTPLHLPFPVEIASGTAVAQSVTLTLRGADGAAAGDADAAPVAVTIGTGSAGKLPALGLGLASHGQPLGERELARLRALHLAHLRVDLALDEVDWPATLRRAAGEARSLGAALECALSLSDNAEEELRALVAALREVEPPVARWLIFHRGEKVTGERWVALARHQLAPAAPGVPVGGGTNAYFTELNRQRPDPTALDLICYSINPQVHAFDDTSLLETCAGQTATIASARAFCAERPLSITPITLRPRFNPNATGTEGDGVGGAPPFAVDARQMALFGAAWTVASLRALASGDVASTTYYETTGPRGVMETGAGSPWPDFPSLPGGVFPLYHVLADAGEFAGGDLLPVTTSDPLGAGALALRRDGRTAILLANLRPEPQRVAVHLTARRVRIRRLDETNAETAMRSPEGYRADDGETLIVESGMLTLDLLPYAVARLDVEDGITRHAAG